MNLRPALSAGHPSPLSMTSTTVALHTAIEGDQLDLVLRLMPHAQLEERCRQRTALHTAVLAERYAITEALLKAGARHDATTDKERQPLHIAAEHSDPRLAALLLAHGADPEGGGNAPLTPLMLAASLGYTEVCRALLEGGAAINRAQVQNLKTSLHLAAAENHHSTVELLLARGATLDARARLRWEYNVFGNLATPFELLVAQLLDEPERQSLAVVLLREGAQVVPATLTILAQSCAARFSADLVDELLHHDGEADLEKAAATPPAGASGEELRAWLGARAARRAAEATLHSAQP